MKLKKARQIGKVCGLSTDEECFLNIELHCMSLFVYDEIDKELDELRKDCEENRVDWKDAIDKFNDRLNKVNNENS